MSLLFLVSIVYTVDSACKYTNNFYAIDKCMKSVTSVGYETSLQFKCVNSSSTLVEQKYYSDNTCSGTPIITTTTSETGNCNLTGSCETVIIRKYAQCHLNNRFVGKDDYHPINQCLIGNRIITCNSNGVYQTFYSQVNNTCGSTVISNETIAQPTCNNSTGIGYSIYCNGNWYGKLSSNINLSISELSKCNYTSDNYAVNKCNKNTAATGVETSFKYVCETNNTDIKAIVYNGGSCSGNSIQTTSVTGTGNCNSNGTCQSVIIRTYQNCNSNTTISASDVSYPVNQCIPTNVMVTCNENGVFLAYFEKTVNGICLGTQSIAPFAQAACNAQTGEGSAYYCNGIWYGKLQTVATTTTTTTTTATTTTTTTTTTTAPLATTKTAQATTTTVSTTTAALTTKKNNCRKYYFSSNCTISN